MSDLLEPVRPAGDCFSLTSISNIQLFKPSVHLEGERYITFKGQEANVTKQHAKCLELTACRQTPATVQAAVQSKHNHKENIQSGKASHRAYVRSDCSPDFPAGNGGRQVGCWLLPGWHSPWIGPDHEPYGCWKEKLNGFRLQR